MKLPRFISVRFVPSALLAMVVFPLYAGNVSAAPGAAVPFTSLEAESPANTTNGTTVTLKSPLLDWTPTPELEASNRGYVELRNVGDYVEFSGVPAGNALVIRHCIPDAPEGNGITASLGFYVNGQRRQDLSLTSKYNWLYAPSKTSLNGQSNTPTAFPHVFWDEGRYLIPSGFKAGDKIRLQKDAGDTAAFYRIDVVDFEQAAPPSPRPENSLSVADYGASGKGEDAKADTAAIQKCIADAKQRNATVWFPPGKYLQSANLLLDGVRVQGAGMWYVTLYDALGTEGAGWAGNAGFKIAGTGTSVSDLAIDGLGGTSRGKASKGFIGGGANWSIRNVWLSHLTVGLWVTGTDGIVSGCRVRDTYADGININNGKTAEVQGVLVENNHVRGTGDDGIAVLCGAESPHLTQRVTVRHNTVVAPWWASNIDLAGGTGHVIEDNLIADGMGVGFCINLPGAYPMQPLTDSVVRGNMLLRCGSNANGQRRGAIWIYPGSTTINRTSIENNQILEPIFRGIHCTGSEAQNITFRANTIIRPGEDAIFIEPKVNGSGTFEGNTVQGLSPGFQTLVNRASESYTVVQAG